MQKAVKHRARFAVTSIVVAVVILVVLPVSRAGTAPIVEADDPVGAVEEALVIVQDDGDLERALDLVYSAIAYEARTRSGVVNSLHLQSAAIRIGRGNLLEAEAYLTKALRFDTHAPYHDPLAFGLPAQSLDQVPGIGGSWWLAALVSVLSSVAVWRLARRVSPIQ